MTIPAATTPTSSSSRSARPGAGRRAGRRKDDRGFILVTLGLLVIPIAVFTALAVDVSSWYSRATELQRAADAASLAGVVWMPDLGKSESDATPVLAKNDIVDGVDNMSVAMQVGKTGSTSFEVCVTDNKVTQFFGMVFASPTKLTRCATAQYMTPLQLGSPLNYFGGNHADLAISKPGPVPGDARVNPPARSVFGSDDYCWLNVGGVTQGFWDRGGNSDSRYWKYYPYPDNIPYGGSAAYHPDCGTAPPAIPDAPSQTCQVPATDAYWHRDNKYGSGTFPAGWRYREDSNFPHSTLCGYGGTTIHPIPAEKSPNMWPAVEGYSNSPTNGDVYSTHPPSSSNSEHRNTGYWYSIDIPETGFTASSISLQAYDLSANCVRDCANHTELGDYNKNGGLPQTRLEVFRAGALKYDMSAITEISSCDTDWIAPDTRGRWAMQWTQLCGGEVSVSPGDRLYIRVKSNDESSRVGGGANGYALRAVANSPAGCFDVGMVEGSVDCYEGSPNTMQPRLAAYGDMEMYNGIPEGQPTVFFLANVVPNYAGKTLVIDLWDPGDGEAKSWVQVLAPDGTNVDGSPVPSSKCTVSERGYNSSAETSVSTAGGAFSGTCTVYTANGHGTTGFYNGKWLRFKIDLPTTYGASGSAMECNENEADPVHHPSCWWRIKYFTQGGSLADYTTWSARVMGDPVRLTQ